MTDEGRAFRDREGQGRNSSPPNTPENRASGKVRPGLSPRRKASQPREDDTGRYRERQGGLTRPGA